MADPQAKAQGSSNSYDPRAASDPVHHGFAPVQGPHECPPCVHLFLVLTAMEGASPLDLNLNFFFVSKLFVVHGVITCFSMSPLKVLMAQGHLVCSRCAVTSSLVV